MIAAAWALVRGLSPTVWVIIGLAAWSGYNRLSAMYEKSRADNASEVARLNARSAADQKVARDKEFSAAEKARKAADEYAKQARVSMATADALSTELGGLRSDIAAGAGRCVSGPDAAASGGADGTGTATYLFERCAIEYSRVAKEAERLSRKVTGLQAHVPEQ